MDLNRRRWTFMVPSHGRGHRFNPCTAHHKINQLHDFRASFVLHTDHPRSGARSTPVKDGAARILSAIPVASDPVHLDTAR